MTPDLLRDLLEQLRAGRIEVDQALHQLRDLPFKDLEYARVDHHRSLRQGLPEVIFGQQKTAEQIVGIAREIVQVGSNLLITRISTEKAAAVCQRLPSVEFDPVAEAAFQINATSQIKLEEPVLVLSAGTSDAKVAAEAMLTLRVCGVPGVLIQDVGVAGLQRLIAELPRLQKAPAILVIAGMEGALASVVGGLVACPVVAVPTSVGYGAAFDGLAALLGMMTSCAAGISVVNIDNGFGGAVAVARMVMGPMMQKGAG
ncbi:MAG TPA: nickel pincer cofactor biosynthesis protein LarB [Polyangiaceae bacterium]|nr:nickel pincer cofactor biosynthesis protein LarB [Polyangiaceae bacterium]